MALLQRAGGHRHHWLIITDYQDVGSTRRCCVTLILVGCRHALRVSELVSLRWDMVDLKKGLLHVTRLKNGIDSVQPLRGPEPRALRKLRREYPDTPYIFVTERGGPMTDSNVRKMVKRAGENAEIGFLVHPHMLRHSSLIYSGAGPVPSRVSISRSGVVPTKAPVPLVLNQPAISTITSVSTLL